MNIYIIIAQVLGIFFAVAGLSMVVNSKHTATAIEESVQNKGILFMWGITALLIGAIIIALNNAWTLGLPLLVAVLGWLALIKGAFILIFPNSAASLYKSFNKGGMLILCGVVAFILGLILLYWAFL